MSDFASTVVRLLEELKRLTTSDQHAPSSAVTEDARPPKRPWEDLSQEEEQAARIEVLPVTYCSRLSCPDQPMLVSGRQSAVDS